MKTKTFDRKTELQDAAFNEFSDKSYEDASLNNIIKNAGISKGTFYYHFRDKEALYLSLIQATTDAKMEFLSRKMQDYAQNENLSLFESLRLQARFGIEFAKEYPKYYFFGMMFLKEKGNKIFETAMNMQSDTTEKYFDDLLEKAIKNKDIRSDVPERFAKKIIGYLFSRYDKIFDVKAEALDFDLMLRDLDSLIDFMQNGLGSQARGEGL